MKSKKVHPNYKVKWLLILFNNPADQEEAVHVRCTSLPSLGISGTAGVESAGKALARMRGIHPSTGTAACSVGYGYSSKKRK